MDLFGCAPPQSDDSPDLVEIPLVASLPYDPATSSFSKFPAQHGFVSIDGAWDLCCATEDPSRPSMADLAQSWLFFGLIAEFLGRPVDVADFSLRSEDNGKICISCSNLHKLLRRWKADLPMFDSRRARQDRGRHISKLLRTAVSQVEIFDCLTPGLVEPELPVTTLAIRLLVQCLFSVAITVLDYLRRDEYLWFEWRAADELLDFSDIALGIPLPPGCEQPTAAARLLIDRTVKAGWCHHVVRRLCHTHTWRTCNYISLLRPHTASNIDHGHCAAAEKCIANNVKLTDAYATRHVKNGCECSPLSVSTEAVIKIIHNQGIPLISISQDPNEPDLKLVTARPRTVYTAVSHVWSDGLGNPAENALPRCQIERLSAILKSRPRRPGVAMEGNTRKESEPRGYGVKQSRSLFWMDTFCIPVGSPDDLVVKEAKFRAINHMAPIYAGAFDVLVLDSGLEHLNVVDDRAYMLESLSMTPKSSTSLPTPVSSRAKVSAHILASAWMGRSWTLQEGSLGRSCVFQLQEGSYRPSNNWYWYRGIIPWAREPSVSPMQQVAYHYEQDLPLAVLEALDEDRKFSKHMTHTIQSRTAAMRVTQFVNAWNNLLDRTTTQPEDQHVIFANLLDFNAFHVQRLDKERRIPSLIRACEELPLSLLFNTGPKLQSPEYPEWMPANIAGARLTLGGLITRNEHGMLIEAGKPSAPLLIYKIEDHISHLENFRLEATETVSSGPYYIQAIKQPADTASGGVEQVTLPSHSKDFVILLDRSTGASSDNCFLARGAILSIAYTLEKQIFVEFQCPIIARTQRQLRRMLRPAPVVDMPLVEAIRITEEWQLVVKSDYATTETALTRRQLFSEDSRTANLIPGLIYVLTLIFIAVFIKKFTDQLSGHARTVYICVLSTTLPVVMLGLEACLHNIWRRAHHTAYLETFDESWSPEKGIDWRKHFSYAWKEIWEEFADDSGLEWSWYSLWHGKKAAGKV